ncbi:hypothetical protein D3C71_2034970 [compost metagenome]
MQTVEMNWDSIDFRARVQLPRQVLIKRVQVVRVERMPQEDGMHLGIHVQIECTPYEDDQYYEVPIMTRWKFGAAYLALALFLFYMIRQVHQVGILNL